MLGIQLEALSVAEVRRLLDLARSRGQEGLARHLEAELAARRGRPALRPMVIPQPIETSSRMTPEPAAARTPPARRRGGAAVAVASLASVIAAALAWGISLPAPQPPAGQTALAVNADRVTQPRIAVALTATALPEEAGEQLAEEPAAPAPVAYPSPEAPRVPSRNPCLDLPTAQARLVCGYPSLGILDRQMKSALARARANGADVATLEGAQAEWQRGSTNLSDRLALRDRYAARIAELQSQ